MQDSFKQTVLKLTGAKSIQKVQAIQSLWSGYGEISRYALKNGPTETVVIKHVQLPRVPHGSNAQHPRGWNTDLSHQRKIRSYEVECTWYSAFSQQCHEECRVPQCYGVHQQDDEYLMILEDLDAHGFANRKSSASLEDMTACLMWLANFHAQFLYCAPSQTNKPFEGLWQTGCYWHLETRPDELAALKDIPLKDAAIKIDQALKETQFQTLVHGDAKLANFCFSEKSNHVAAVDFQYVGLGCGMKDVAYFIGSCLDEDGCERYVDTLLNLYFTELENAIARTAPSIDFHSVEADWRPLFPIAWADFHRFLKGWSPDHWKIHGFSEQITQKALKTIGS